MHAVKILVVCMEIHAWTTSGLSERVMIPHERSKKSRMLIAYCLEALNKEWTSFGDFMRNQNGKRLLISSKDVSR